MLAEHSWCCDWAAKRIQERSWPKVREIETAFWESERWCTLIIMFPWCLKYAVKIVQQESKVRLRRTERCKYMRTGNRFCSYFWVFFVCVVVSLSVFGGGGGGVLSRTVGGFGGGEDCFCVYAKFAYIVFFFMQVDFKFDLVDRYYIKIINSQKSEDLDILCVCVCLSLFLPPSVVSLPVCLFLLFYFCIHISKSWINNLCCFMLFVFDKLFFMVVFASRTWLTIFTHKRRCWKQPHLCCSLLIQVDLSLWSWIVHVLEQVCVQGGSGVEVCLLVGCLTPQQHASVSQGWTYSDNCTCCHTEIEVADPTFYLTQSQYTDNGPTSPSTDPRTPGAWQGSHWSANF